MEKEKIIAQGAEALLVKEKNFLVKKRISKGYRHPELDKKLRIRRTRSEAKLLEKAGKIINIPKVSEVNDYDIKMWFVSAKPLSEELDKMNINKAIKICFILGNEIAKLHNHGLVHGDLTTSNMLFYKNKIWFVDFGLGFHSSRVEDKAVDLHLLRQAFESKHFLHWKKYFDSAISGYKKESNNAEKILSQLEKVEGRGRYKGKH